MSFVGWPPQVAGMPSRGMLNSGIGDAASGIGPTGAATGSGIGMAGAVTASGMAGAATDIGPTGTATAEDLVVDT